MRWPELEALGLTENSGIVALTFLSCEDARESARRLGRDLIMEGSDGAGGLRGRCMESEKAKEEEEGRARARMRSQAADCRWNLRVPEYA